MNIYVASSWKNEHQPVVVEMLRALGNEVYDFRQQYREALRHTLARNGFYYDMQALRKCQACVLVLPSGHSASWEFGWACGKGKCGTVYMPEACEPELMYADYPIQTTMPELLSWAVEISRHISYAAE